MAQVLPTHLAMLPNLRQRYFLLCDEKMRFLHQFRDQRYFFIVRRKAEEHTGANLGK